MSFPIAPRDAGASDLESVRRHAVRIASVVNLAMGGKLNAVVNGFTLTANDTTTTLTNARLGVNSFVYFDPLTANAAAELAAGTLYILSADRMNGAFSITHANDSSTDRAFNILIIG